VRLLEGDAAVLRPDARGQITVIGVIGAQRWGDLIRDMSANRQKATEAPKPSNIVEKRTQVTP
jgi:hypothetical protein